MPVLSKPSTARMNEPHASGAPAVRPAEPAAQRGTDTSRLAAALEAHFALVWRSLRRFGLPDGDVDDAAQTAFITLSSRLADVPAGSERAFLLGTCQRLAANQRKKLSRRPEVADDELDRRASAGPNPEQALVEKQRRLLLDDGLRELPLDQRTVFVLFELEGFSLPEIAESLGIPLGTATSRLRRAREKFEAWASAVKLPGEQP
jgi:RNA polymerase sigma-70 factor, ECF subfamily